MHTECGLVRTALNGLAADLAEPQGQLKQALEDAAAANFTVHEDGSVSFPAAKSCTVGGETEFPAGKVSGSARSALEAPGLGEQRSPFLVSPNQTRAQDIADRIAKAVRSAVAIDAKYAQTLKNLKAVKGLDVTQATLKDVHGDTADVREAAGGYLGRDIPDDKSPAERKQWWDSLSEEQRQDYLNVAPDLIGNLDGIPAVTRDEANRRYLPLLIDKLAAQGDSETELAGLRMIQDKLKEPSRVPMFLLGIGDEGNGRAIVSYGNPDTSRNVSAYVPGLGTKLDDEDFEDTLKRAQDTAIGARMVDPSSASIIWLGYDAPQHVDVMSTGSAERGAPAYNQFMAGLEATNQNKDPHLTAIGHSYGSFTVGTAAKQSGGIPGVDDIILLGSPGVGTEKAEDLGVGKNHVFVGAADNDPVTHLPSKDEFAMGGPLGGFLFRDLLDAGNDDVYFGKDPASEAFGAQRFLVDDGPRMIQDVGGFDAHSQYFTREGEGADQVSADNIATIVAGQPEKIVKEEYR